jgi:GAF domain-containing protein
MPFKGLAEDFALLARELATQPNRSSALSAISHKTVETVDGAEYAAISLKNNLTYKTVAATGEVPPLVDQLQYDAEEGPCVDSLRDKARLIRSDDVTTDPRWPVFGQLASKSTPVISIMSHRLYLEDGSSLGALNIYSSKPAAFSDHALSTLDTLATHAAIALVKATAVEESRQLQQALTSNRVIGVAMGILMATYKTTLEESFDLLRLASQHSHQKLAEIALGVVETGQLELGR